MDCHLPSSSVQWNSLGKNTGVGCHFLLQGIFMTQGSNPGLLICRQILYSLSYQGFFTPTMIVVIVTIWLPFLCEDKSEINQKSSWFIFSEINLLLKVEN